MDELIRGLLRPDAYAHPVAKFDVLETHISWVILTGDFAYKLKKPVNFGFVDFSTLDKRRFCCDEELRLNRRMADDLYLAVRPIFGRRAQASFVGTGEPIEYAVQMRQFPQSALLPAVLERDELTPELIDRLAVDVARFQRNAPVAGPDAPYGSPAAVRAPVDGNFQALKDVAEHKTIIRQLRDWCDCEFNLRNCDFAQRKSTGMVREGHGDMHLGNMLLRGDHIEVFDCLEFNPSLRWIDVISEIAFLVMDLADRHRPDLGWRFLNGWLEQTGDYAGLRLWAWYYCYRALVRAKVAALRRGQSDVTSAEVERLNRQLDDYLQLARRATTPAPPQLIITSGVSGSGKSFWSQQIAAERGCVRMRSDVERKRLFGADADLYSATAMSQTYEHLRDSAAMVLQSGLSVIVDATFLRRAQRDPFRNLARQLSAPACLIEFTASPNVLRARIATREWTKSDPSDATADVMEQQLVTREPIAADEGWTVITIDTERSDVAESIRTQFDVVR